jgi:hypothetical protein
MIATLRLFFLLVFVGATAFHAEAGAPIDFVGYKSPSAPVFSKAGPTVINYKLFEQYTGIHKPGGGLTDEGFVVVIIRDLNNNVLYSYEIQSTTEVLGTSQGPHLLVEGSFQFTNPSNQSLTIEEQIWWTRPLEGLAGFPSQEWSSASGKSFVSGGDRRPIGTPTPIATQLPTTGSNIHAVIISGRSDPARIITSSNVTLTGGVIALGKDPSPPAKPTTQWSSGLRIIPDQSLLTGAKIPPLTPNIVDVRIVKHEVVGDLAVPKPSPSP